MAEPNYFVLKVVLCGDFGVGKSSLMRREANGVFDEGNLFYIGVDFAIKHYLIE